MSDVLRHLGTHYHYVIYIALMLIGLFAVLAKGNLIKKVIGLNVLQTAVFLFYISIGRKADGTAPVLWDQKPETIPYENPVPHVLMLTAIVVGVSITAVALALIIRIKRAYGTMEESEILVLDESDQQGSA
ncbi:MAG: cation:proton antiporter subunit C [Planctomycetota bacterium]|nr:cation:proton antiporter subunit C [Planctomycetota bacterium]